MRLSDDAQSAASSHAPKKRMQPSGSLAQPNLHVGFAFLLLTFL
ncbi:hypothetical protein GCWU000324_01744 [Kingella oralis ATCC 51147]|uniref:Uncharacterized protein n=1 Tax=Kingella oralis ATCC 51147 TaxID=629741 RepID=C4GL87_9NEIS|nr:hypothetical protein GCWU000324_01744 [Kingella oralis ATCC 51147]